MYTCERCGLQCKYRYLLERHLKRKVPCIGLLSDKGTTSLLADISDSAEKRYQCKHCQKLFKNKQSKYIHQRSCEVENVVVKVDIHDTVKKLQAEIAELKANGVCTVINSGNTINNTQNIHIHVTPKDFSHENTEYLGNQFLYECFKDQEIINVVRELHFNPEHPENHNVRLKNEKKSQMEVIENGNWVVDTKDSVLDTLIMNGWRVIRTYYNTNKDSLEEDMEEREFISSVRWMNSISKGDEKLMKQLKNDAFLLVRNNKAMLMAKS